MTHSATASIVAAWQLCAASIVAAWTPLVPWQVLRPKGQKKSGSNNYTIGSGTAPQATPQRRRRERAEEGFELTIKRLPNSFTIRPVHIVMVAAVATADVGVTVMRPFLPLSFDTFFLSHALSVSQSSRFLPSTLFLPSPLSFLLLQPLRLLLSLPSHSGVNEGIWILRNVPV
jgi:hypothetical protein